MKNLLKPLLIVFFLLIGIKALAVNLYVDPLGDDGNTGTDPAFPLLKIQTAIINATDGDSVIVSPGNYVLDSALNFLGKNVKVVCVDKHMATIDAITNACPYAVKFTGTETVAAELNGFSILINLNTGIGCSLEGNASPTLINNIFKGDGLNTGIYCYGSNNPVINRNIFESVSYPITLNTGLTTAEILNNTMAGPGDDVAEAIYIPVSGLVKIENNIIFGFNIAVNALDYSTVKYNLLFNIVQPDPGYPASNIYSDPMIRADYTYSPAYGSPAIDAGDPLLYGSLLDPDSSAIDIGAIPYTHLKVIPMLSPVKCYNDSNGTVFLTTLGGYGNYYYKINGKTADYYTDTLKAGVYSFEVTDDEGASYMNSFVIPNTPPLSINNVAIIQPDKGAGEGKIKVDVSGGTPPLYEIFTVGTSQFGNTLDTTIYNIAAGTDTVVVVDNNYCSAKAQFTMTSQLCTINYLAKNLTYIDKANGIVKFDIKTKDADSLYFQFGDGTDTTMLISSDSVSFVHVYSYPFDYMSSLILYNSANGCEIRYDMFADVQLSNNSCNLIFDASSSVGLNAKVDIWYTYQLESSDSITVIWNANGDKQTFYNVIPDQVVTYEHPVSKAGLYNLTFIINGTNCTTNTSQDIWVAGDSCINPVLTYEIDTVKTDSVVFTSRNIKADYYYWSINGVGNYYNQYYFETTDSVLGVRLPMNDKYEVWLQTNDTINFCYGYDSASFILGNVQCLADFKTFPSENVNEVGFHSSSFTTSGNPIYYWDFGDFSPVDSLSYLYHDFGKTGAYDVTLTIVDGTCKNSITKKVYVGDIPCKADFKYTLHDDTVVSFTSSAMGANMFYWDFGDYGYSDEENPVHSYAEKGIYKVYQFVYNSSNYCWDEIYKEVMVGTPQDFIIAKYSYYNAEDSFVFEADTNNITYWYWTFGDGSSAEGSKVSHSYKRTGMYEVCLSVYNENSGEYDSKCDYIVYGSDSCVVLAGFSYMSDPQTNKVQFQNKSQGDFDKYYWDFGDGSTSSEMSPSHQYVTPGYYEVSLSVKKAGTGCADAFTEYIQIGEIECRASFGYMVKPGTNNVKFSNNSKGAAYYYWYFGDGGEAYDKEPEYEFKQSGLYVVGLTTSNELGDCYDYTEQFVQVGDVNCSAHFSYYVDKPSLKAYCKNEAIANESSEFYWLFGDGEYSTEKDPVHQFYYPGYYTVSLSTFNSNSWCFDYYESVILVGDSGIDCEAKFIYMTSNNSNEVKFTDKSKGTIANYIWDFGDGQYAFDEPNPKHTYSSGGYYYVCQNVFNTHGTPNISCEWINVSPSEATNCQARYNYSVDTASKTVVLIDKSIGSPTSYFWDFGDGNTSTDSVPEAHVYTEPGYYLTSLYIQTAAGCESFDYKLVNVTPVDSFLVSFGARADETATKAGDYPVDFVGAGIGDHARLRWNFGDGSPYDTTSNRPRHIYSEPGEYQVCLTYEDPITQQKSESCQMVNTAPACNGDATLPVANCKNVTVKLNSQGYAKIGLSDVNNGSTDNCGIKEYVLQADSFTIANLGDNVIYLEVIDNAGNSSKCNATVTVQEGDAIFIGDAGANFATYPNPFFEDLTISFNLRKTAKVEISVLDMLGRKVHLVSSGIQFAGHKEFKISGKQLKSGSYLVQVKYDGNEYRQNVVKR